MATISVCLIAQDVEPLLPRWLANVAPVAHEIVAVDGGSRDATPRLLESHPKVRLFHRPFDGHGPQRNFAIDQARGDWILSVDADELLGDRLRHILPRLARIPCVSWAKVPRYWVASLDPLCHVHAALLYPDRQLRLFRNQPRFRYLPEPRVHERLPENGLGRGLRLRGAHLFHLAFLLQGREERERKVKDYLDLDPSTAAITDQYLYEGLTHRLEPCVEGCRELAP
ncbi:MAG: glycosyltransferase [Planctomycetaceae bacterium]